MTKYLACDVGIRGIGCAYFVGDELLRAWYEPEPTAERGPAKWCRVAATLNYLRDDPSLSPDVLVIETMKVYAGRQGFGKDPDDLLELQGIAGALAFGFRGGRVVGVLARDWKGQVPKQVMTERIRTWITRRGWLDRLAVPKPARLVHNAIDAAGLGMVYLGLEGRLQADGRAKRVAR